MENKVCLFKETPITFIIDKNNNMMINATEMAKPYGKKVNEFMSNSTTTEFINEALKSGNSRFLNVFSQNDLFYSVQKNRNVDAPRFSLEVCSMAISRI